MLKNGIEEPRLLPFDGVAIKLRVKSLTAKEQGLVQGGYELGKEECLGKVERLLKKYMTEPISVSRHAEDPTEWLSQKAVLEDLTRLLEEVS